MTTDAYVVSPIFFPGGDIGSLAVNGTINDIAMAGARPLYLSASFVIEEGLPLADLARRGRQHGRGLARGRRSDHHRRHQGRRARQGGQAVRFDRGRRRRAARARPVERRGPAGRRRRRLRNDRRSRRRRHVEAREPRIRDGDLSDTAALHGLVADMVAVAGPGLRVMRDPTRGGLAATLNELAHQSGVGFLHRGGRDPGPRRGRRGLRVPRPRPAQRRQRRQARGDRRAGIRRRGSSPRCGPIRSARNPPSSAGRSRTPIASWRCAPLSAGGGSSTGSPASSSPAFAEAARKDAARAGCRRLSLLTARSAGFFGGGSVAGAAPASPAAGAAAARLPRAARWSRRGGGHDPPVIALELCLEERRPGRVLRRLLGQLRTRARACRAAAPRRRSTAYPRPTSP